MEKNRAPPPNQVKPDSLPDAKKSRKEAILQSLRNLRWRLGNAILNANKGIANKH